MSEARRLKSRAGCLQCKRRKVKCDQKQPACLQCSRQKLQCPGYQKPLKWIDTSEDLKATAPTETQRRTSKARRASQSTQSSLISTSKEALVHKRSPSVPKQLNDESSALIQHYFTRVCKIAGCFDSDISPFRTIPAAMMSHSRPVFLLLQASSAAQLSRQQPTMRYKALLLQSEAFSAVRNEISNIHGSMVVSDELMLTCIIAGLTSSWYDVNDLGLSHVLGSQFLLLLWLASKKRRLEYQETFILGAYVYWLAISAFVTGDPRSSYHFQEGLQERVQELDMNCDVSGGFDSTKASQRIYPHPLTGFSMQTFICVGKVGSLCRLAHEVSRNLLDTTDQYEELEEKAKSVEIQLLRMLQPLLPNFQDPQDSQTTVDEILAVGEAYRCAGLLQLYMSFPQLLQCYRQEHVYNENVSWEGQFLLELSYQDFPSDTNFNQSRHNWLRRLAFHILSILESIPPTSGTRVLQGLPALIAATWFVDSVEEDWSFEHPLLPVGISSRSKDEGRQIVRQGLQMHEQYVGLQQVSRVLEILEEVWRRDDEEVGKCDWIVLVASKGLQTLYG